MNEYELREVTRLVGESLVDLDVEDGSDVIVVAGELVDAQDFILDFDDGGGDVGEVPVGVIRGRVAAVLWPPSEMGAVRREAVDGGSGEWL